MKKYGIKKSPKKTAYPKRKARSYGKSMPHPRKKITRSK